MLLNSPWTHHREACEIYVYQTRCLPGGICLCFCPRLRLRKESVLGAVIGAAVAIELANRDRFVGGVYANLEPLNLYGIFAADGRAVGAAVNDRHKLPIQRATAFKYPSREEWAG